MKFNLLQFFRCLSEGHRFTNSKAHPGRYTCMRCGLRRKG